MDQMTQVLAAEGGYQAFTLTSTEWGWLIFAAAVAVFALLLGVVLMRGVLKQEQGTDKMQEIAGAIQEGALAYLKRQFRTIGIIVVPLAVVVFLTSTAINKMPVLEVGGKSVIGGEEVMSFLQSGLFRTAAFIMGCLFSAVCGSPFAAMSAPPLQRSAATSTLHSRLLSAPVASLVFLPLVSAFSALWSS